MTFGGWSLDVCVEPRAKHGIPMPFSVVWVHAPVLYHSWSPTRHLCVIRQTCGSAVVLHDFLRICCKVVCINDCHNFPFALHEFEQLVKFQESILAARNGKLHSLHAFSRDGADLCGVLINNVCLKVANLPSTYFSYRSFGMKWPVF